MANVIKPKRSYTASNTPSLAAGELAIQAADKKVLIGNSTGTGSILIASLSLSDMVGSTTNITEGTNLYYTDSRARLSLSAGTGISYNSTTGAITNSSPDQTVVLTAGTGISTSGTYPNFTITNSSPDQTVKLTGGTGISVTGTYPNFTVTNTSPSSGGTVTSVAMTVPTGLSISGTPITSSGTLAVTLTAGYSIPTTASQTNWDTAYTNRITSLTTTGSSGSATLVSNTLNVPTYTLSGLGGQASSTNLTSLSGLSYVSASFVKMTASGTFSLDTNTYLTANQSITLSGDISGTGSTSITTTLATVSIAKGGTGQTTQQAAINALTGTQSSGKYLRSDGTNAALTAIQAADVPTLNQNTTGSSASCTGNAATSTKTTNIIGGNSTTLLGSIPYQSNTDTTSFLSPNTTTTKNFLAQTGTGTNGAAPAWSTVSKSDVGLGSVENTALSTWAGSSNITTLGTISTGTWSGTNVALNKGGTNAALTAAAGGIVYSTATAMAITAAGTAGQLLTSNGSSAPSWTDSPGVPTGSLMPYAGSAAPTGYLLCDASAVSRTTYSALFAVIGTTYGAGNGSTTFNLPDLRGRLPMGAGTGTGLNASGTGLPTGTAQTARTAGQWLGEETHALTTAELASHTHANTLSANTGSMNSNASHTHGSGATGFWVWNSSLGGTFAGGSTYNASAASSSTTASTNIDHTHPAPTLTNAAAGSGTAHNTIPPCVVLNYIIKT